MEGGAQTANLRHLGHLPAQLAPGRGPAARAVPRCTGYTSESALSLLRVPAVVRAGSNRRPSAFQDVVPIQLCPLHARCSGNSRIYSGTGSRSSRSSIASLKQARSSSSGGACASNQAGQPAGGDWQRWCWAGRGTSAQWLRSGWRAPGSVLPFHGRASPADKSAGWSAKGGDPAVTRSHQVDRRQQVSGETSGRQQYGHSEREGDPLRRTASRPVRGVAWAGS
jgi:hypothetical protein